MKHLIYGLVILFLLILLFRAECGKPKTEVKEVKIEGKKYEIVKTKLDTVYVKVKPEVYYKTQLKVDTVIYQKIDSHKCEEVKMDYFAKKVFLDTIRFGSAGNIYLRDTVKNNAILNRAVNSDLVFANPREVTIVKEKPKNELYFGPRIDFSNGSIIPNMGLMLKTKRNRLYGVSLGIGAGGPVYSGSLYIKL